MSYATAADFVSRFSDREARMLTDRSNAGAVDAVLLQNTLDEASQLIDGYVGRRYALPLTSITTGLTVVPETLKRLACDLARYNLTGTAVMETEAIRNRYKDAIKVLGDISEGKVSLGVDLQTIASPTAAIGGATASRAAERDFGSDVLDRMF